DVATLRVHVEVIPDMTEFSTKASIFRESPVTVTVDKSPFLEEGNVSEAKIIDSPGGGFQLEIHFDQHGTWMLEQYTTTNPGKHFAVFSEWGHNLKESRWLGAPIINRRISNGILIFTPDASREEAESIVKGLNYLVEKMANRPAW